MIECITCFKWSRAFGDQMPPTRGTRSSGTRKRYRVTFTCDNGHSCYLAENKLRVEWQTSCTSRCERGPHSDGN